MSSPKNLLQSKDIDSVILPVAKAGKAANTFYVNTASTPNTGNVLAWEALRQALDGVMERPAASGIHYSAPSVRPAGNEQVSGATSAMMDCGALGSNPSKKGRGWC